MSKKYRISVVGYGYVGKAQAKLLERRGDVEIVPFDDNLGFPYKGREELMRSSDLVIVCVPTPRAPDGSVDVSIVRSAVADVARATADCPVPILIRSTVMVGTTDSIGISLGVEDRLNFSPEFVVERTGEDALDRMIVGGPDADVILRIYEPCLEVGAALYSTSADKAEFVKYRTNAFLAVKVAFAVEMDRLADSFGFREFEKETILRMWLEDVRTGSSHNEVIADERGRVGFGGKCLPKDTSALVKAAEALGEDTPLLDGAMRYVILDD